MIVIYICIFFLGASLASFLNATLYRIEKGYRYPKIVMLGSHCEKCKHMLTWWELIPVLGYILVGGKCSKCEKKINLYYPLSEFLLGLVLLLFFLYSIQWYLWIIAFFLFVLSYHDSEYKAIPKNMVHIFLLFSFLIFFFFVFNPQNLLAPLVVCLSLLIMNAVKKSFGMGDILILFSLGILFSWANFLVLFWLGIMLALLYSVILIIKGEKNIRKIKIPMIPFFAIAFSIVVLYGEPIYTLLVKFLRLA
jgi:prepilin signal peptidase PulO-like enzyme (type II secretory pathway)